MLIIYMMSGISFKLIFKSLKPIMPIILFTCILNMFFIHGEGDPLVKLGFITIYAEGINTSVFMTVRIVFLIVGMSLLTYTTSPIALTDAIERLLSPLKKLHFPVHEGRCYIPVGSGSIHVEGGSQHGDRGPRGFNDETASGIGCYFQIGFSRQADFSFFPLELNGIGQSTFGIEFHGSVVGKTNGVFPVFWNDDRVIDFIDFCRLFFRGGIIDFLFFRE